MKKKQKNQYNFIGIRKMNGDSLVAKLKEETSNAFIVTDPRYNGSKQIAVGTYYIDMEEVEVYFYG